MFFFIIFTFSLFFFKNIFYSWITIEILTLITVFICLNNNNIKNTMKLFYYLMIHTFLGFILIYLIIFSYNSNIILLFLCAKLGRFPRIIWIPEIMPFFSTKNFFILLSLPKVYPMLFFFFLEIDNIILITVISFFSIFFRSFRSLFSNNFKNFFTYARISQLGFFFFILIIKISFILLFFILYFIVLSFFFLNNKKTINFLPILCFLSYRRLPFRLPFYFKYITILNLRNRFIFFFIFLLYYLFIVVFLRFVWFYKINKVGFKIKNFLFILFFFLFTPFFFFFYI